MRRSSCALVFAAALAVTISVRAQSPTFEVASVKPSNPNPPAGDAGPVIVPALGRLTAQNVTLRLLVATAWQKQPFQIIGGPQWIASDTFDINARAADATLTTDQILTALQVLLVDRFKLKVHTETREGPIYALVMSRDDRRMGPQLKPSIDNCPDFKSQQQQEFEMLARGGIEALAPKPGEDRRCSVATVPAIPGNFSIGLKARGQTIDTMALMLTELLARPVVNKTGLSGIYDFDLVVDFATLQRVAAEHGGTAPPLPPNAQGPSLMTYMQEELGLKLDSQRGSDEVLVIDQAERPTAN